MSFLDADAKRANAEDLRGWLDAYMAVGLTRDEAIRIIVASASRPVPATLPPEVVEVYSKLAPILNRQLMDENE